MNPAAAPDAAGPWSSARLGRVAAGLRRWRLSDDELAFKRRVYDVAVAARLAAGAVRTDGVDDDALARVEGVQLRADVAPRAAALLAGLRGALAAARCARDPDALATRAVFVTEGYRHPGRDLLAWDDHFARTLDRTADARAAAPGGPFGEAATAAIVAAMGEAPVPPGFAPGSSGAALSLDASVDGTRLGADPARAIRWRHSWPYLWLCGHAACYGFRSTPAEPWRWHGA